MLNPDPSTAVPKRLLIRLSSLGDVILAASALEVYRARGERVDWLISKQYAEILEDHPAIGKLWVFDRRDGLAGWLRLAQLLWQEKYSEVYDLHSTLRSALLWLLFTIWGFSGSKPLWRRISKQRFQLYGQFLFKGLWPKSLSCSSVASRSALLCGGDGTERANLGYLAQGKLVQPALIAIIESHRESHGQSKRPYFCVMPSAKWEGKKWPTRYFAETLKALDMSSVVMGTMKDKESLALLEGLKGNSKVYSAVGFYKLKEVATVLSGAKFYLGNDTGLGHLAEALGTPALVLMGPTTPEMGFSPWRKESQILQANLWCRPCGKDGRFCFRVQDRYKCMRVLSAESVNHYLESRTDLGFKKLKKGQSN